MALSTSAVDRLRPRSAPAAAARDRRGSVTTPFSRSTSAATMRARSRCSAGRHLAAGEELRGRLQDRERRAHVVRDAGGDLAEERQPRLGDRLALRGGRGARSWPGTRPRGRRPRHRRRGTPHAARAAPRSAISRTVPVSWRMGWLIRQATSAPKAPPSTTTRRPVCRSVVRSEETSASASAVRLEARPRSSAGPSGPSGRVGARGRQHRRRVSALGDRSARRVTRIDEDLAGRRRGSATRRRRIASDSSRCRAARDSAASAPIGSAADPDVGRASGTAAGRARPCATSDQARPRRRSRSDVRCRPRRHRRRTCRPASNATSADRRGRPRSVWSQEVGQLLVDVAIEERPHDFQLAPSS